MIYVFSMTADDGRVFWYKNVNDLPVINGMNMQYHIYPVYEIGGKTTNLLREKIFLKDGQFLSHYFHLQKYMNESNGKQEKIKQEKEIKEIFVYGVGESTTVFIDEAAYIHYSIIAKSCYRVTF